MFEQFLPHHRATMERTVEEFRPNPNYRALIIGGSLIKGYGRPDSDVDVMLITTDEEFERLSANREATFYRPDLVTYEGGYVDGKYLNMQFLHESAAKGSEPTRWSFKDAIIAYSDIPDLQALIDQIAQYPIAEQETKIRAFYGQFIIWNWFISEAEKRQNAYLMAQASANLVLYGSRLILAHNKMLYPFHKWMMAELERAPEKPEAFFEQTDALLKTPNKQTAEAFFNSINTFREWGVEFRDGINAFTEYSERLWMTSQPAVSDW